MYGSAEVCWNVPSNERQKAGCENACDNGLEEMKIVLQLIRKEFQFLIVEDIGKNLNTGDDRSLFSPISFPYTSGWEFTKVLKENL